MRRYKYLDKKFRKNVFRASSLGLALLMASGSVAPMVSFAEVENVGVMGEEERKVTLTLDGESIQVEYISDNAADYYIPLFNTSNSNMQASLEGKIVFADYDFLEDEEDGGKKVGFYVLKPGRVELNGREVDITVSHNKKTGKQIIGFSGENLELSRDRVYYIKFPSDNSKMPVEGGQNIIPETYKQDALYDLLISSQENPVFEKDELERLLRESYSVEYTSKYITADEAYKALFANKLKGAEYVLRNTFSTRTEVLAAKKGLEDAIDLILKEDNENESDLLPPRIEENTENKLQELKNVLSIGINLQKEEEYLRLGDSDVEILLHFLERGYKLISDPSGADEDDINDVLVPLKQIIESIKEKLKKLKAEDNNSLPPHLDDNSSDRKEDKPVLPPHLEENLEVEIQELKKLVDKAKKFEDDDKFKEFKDADIAALKSFLDGAKKLIANPEGKTKADIDEVLKPLSVMLSSMEKELANPKKEKENKPQPLPPHLDENGDGKQENTPVPQPPHIDNNESGKKEEKPTPPQLGEDLKKKLDQLKELVDEARKLEKEGKFSGFETDDIAALKGFLERADKLAKNPFSENIDDVLKPLSVMVNSIKEELSKREKESTPLPPHLDNKGNDKKEENPSLPPHLEDKKEEKKENKPSDRRESQPSNSLSRRGSSRGSSSSRGGSSGSGARFRRSTGSGTNSGPVASPRTVALPDYVSKTGTWQQASNGIWTYSDRGEQAKDKWVAIQDKANNNNNQQQYNWFRFDKDGHLVTGWYKDSDGSMYYMNTKADGVEGVMRTGWTWIRDSKDGKLKAYYFNTNSDGTKGRMLFGTTVDGYTLNVSGEWVVDGIVQTK